MYLSRAAAVDSELALAPEGPHKLVGGLPKTARLGRAGAPARNSCTRASSVACSRLGSRRSRTGARTEEPGS